MIFTIALEKKKRKKKEEITPLLAIESYETNKLCDSFATQSRKKEKVGEMEPEKGGYSGTSFN